MVLAIGSLMDTGYPAYNIEAEKYHQLARASLFQHPLFDDPTITSIQSLVRGVGNFMVQLLTSCSS